MLGLHPNEQTFLAVLAACTGAEAVEEDFIHFDLMQMEYGISLRIEHYFGLIDVLGKSDMLRRLWNIFKFAL